MRLVQLRRFFRDAKLASNTLSTPESDRIFAATLGVPAVMGPIMPASTARQARSCPLSLAGGGLVKPDWLVPRGVILTLPFASLHCTSAGGQLALGTARDVKRSEGQVPPL